MASLGSIVRVDVRGAQGPRGTTGSAGTGANPFPAVTGETGVTNQAYMPGDIRRYGIEPGDGIDWMVVDEPQVRAWQASTCLDGAYGFLPRGDYNFELDWNSDYNGSIVWADGARFTNGVLHYTGGVSNIAHLGDWYFDDRLGVAGDAGNSEHLRFGRFIGLAGNRGFHFVGCSDVEFELFRSMGMAVDPDTLADVWFEMQGRAGLRGRILVDNSPGNAAFANALEINLDIDVRGYGGSAINITGGSALEGLTEAMTELGSGVILHRCTGEARVRIEQANASPAADTYALLIAETGITGTASRHRALKVSGYVTVGDGNRGVCIGSAENLSQHAVANVEADLHVRLRSANTLASGYAGVNVLPPAATADYYRRLTGSLEFSNFGAVQEFKATAVATAQVRNYTELFISPFKVGDGKGAGRMIEAVGTGGILRGRIEGVVAGINASSTTTPLIDIDGCTGLHLEKATVRSATAVATTALRFANNTDCSYELDTYNFSQATNGGVYLDNNTRCVYGPSTMIQAAISGTAIRFFNTHTDCTLRDIRLIASFAKGFDDGTSTAFTRPVAIGCTATGNTDDTDLTTAHIPAAAQLGCTNLAV